MDRGLVLTSRADAGTGVVRADVVVTADPQRRVLEPGWVDVDAGRIVAVGEGPPPPGRPLLAQGDLVLPGLVSLHQHLVDVLVRGLPTGPTFLDWLLGTYHAGLGRSRPEECGAAVATVRAAGLAAGATTVVDCWSVGPVDDPVRVRDAARASVEAHLASGGRTVFGWMFLDRLPAWPAVVGGLDPSRLCRDADETFAEVEALAGAVVDGSGILTVTPSPEIPEATTDRAFRDAWALAERLGSVLPVHLCTSPPSRAACGPDDLDRLGVLGPRLLGAHCSHVDDHDIGVLGAAGVGIAHCPSSARALGADRLTPVAALRRAGARAGIGLDNASLHAGSDLFAEARQALLAAEVAGDPLDAPAALDLLTVEGAAAAGLGGLTGALVPGLQADLVVLDTSAPRWWPRYPTWPETVVRCATAADVRTVLVDGVVVARDGAPSVAPPTDVVEQAARRIAGR